MWLRSRRHSLGLALTATVPLLGSCVIAADLINPALLFQLGLDPGSLRPPPGKVLVVYVNDTDVLVEFQAYQANDPDDLAGGGVVISANEVPPGENSNDQFECPTGAISLGQVDANFAVNNTGALVFNQPGAGTAIPYNGTVMREGVDYNCGDVIEFRITAVTGQDQNQQQGFVIRARRIPGR